MRNVRVTYSYRLAYVPISEGESDQQLDAWHRFLGPHAHEGEFFRDWPVEDVVNECRKFLGDNPRLLVAILQIRRIGDRVVVAPPLFLAPAQPVRVAREFSRLPEAASEYVEAALYGQARKLASNEQLKRRAEERRNKQQQ